LERSLLVVGYNFRFGVWLVLILCTDFGFGILDLGVTCLVQGPCNKVDFELPCCKCLLQHFISECFGLGTAVIGGSLRNEFCNSNYLDCE